VSQLPPLEKIGDRMRNVGLAMALTVAIPVFGAWLFVALIQLIVEMKKVAKTHGSQPLQDASSNLIAILILASCCIGLSIGGTIGALNEYILVLQIKASSSWKTILYGSLLLASIPIIIAGFACSMCLLASWRNVQLVFQLVPEKSIEDKGNSACKSMKVAQLFTILAMGLGSYIPILIIVVWAVPNLAASIVRGLMTTLDLICIGAGCMGLVSIGLQVRSYFTAGSAFQETGAASTTAGPQIQVQQPRVQQSHVQQVPTVQSLLPREIPLQQSPNQGGSSRVTSQDMFVQPTVQQPRPLPQSAFLTPPSQSSPQQDMFIRPIVQQASPLQSSPQQFITPRLSPQQDIDEDVLATQVPDEDVNITSPVNVPLFVDDSPRQVIVSGPKRVECPYCGNTFVDSSNIGQGNKDFIRICPQCGNSFRL
jgi:hypothetical protein